MIKKDEVEIPHIFFLSLSLFLRFSLDLFIYLSKSLSLSLPPHSLFLSLSRSLFISLSSFLSFFSCSPSLSFSLSLSLILPPSLSLSLSHFLSFSVSFSHSAIKPLFLMPFRVREESEQEKERERERERDEWTEMRYLRGGKGGDDNIMQGEHWSGLCDCTFSLAPHCSIHSVLTDLSRILQSIFKFLFYSLITHSILTAKEFFLFFFKFSGSFVNFKHLSMILCKIHVMFYIKNNQSNILRIKKCII